MIKGKNGKKINKKKEVKKEDSDNQNGSLDPDAIIAKTKKYLERLQSLPEKAKSKLLPSEHFKIRKVITEKYAELEKEAEKINFDRLQQLIKEAKKMLKNTL